MSEKKYDPSHFALASFSYTESMCNALILKGVLTEKEKFVILQVAIDSLNSSENPEFKLAAQLIKDVNQHMAFE